MIRSLCRHTRVVSCSTLAVKAPRANSFSVDSVSAFRCPARLSSTAPTVPSLKLKFNNTPQHVFTSPLMNAARSLSYVTNASNFETEVIQSQQAICLVYYINNSNCSAYLKSAERLVDTINAETSGLDAAAETAKSTKASAVNAPAASTEAEITIETENGTVSGADSKPRTDAPSDANASAAAGATAHKMQWLKLCTINADENRNLASAFSVERAKLPITYFVMQGTIVDKVVGHVAEGRLQSILIKFLEHYQKEMNVDLLARHSKADTKADASASSSSSPLPSAATADLLSGTSTTFLQDKMMNVLVGADMIQLPEEAEQLDGVRKTLQEAKRKAHAELQDLHKQLGMDIRRLTDAEMHAHYFNSPQFRALGVLSALEALYLARSYATLGDVARANVDWARRAVLKDFEPVQGDPALRRVMALVDVNLVRGELRTAATLAAQDANRLRSTLASMDAADVQSEQHRTALREMEAFIAGQSQYCLDMLRIMDEHVDSRTLDGSEFPSAVMDQLMEMLKTNLKLSRTRLPTGVAGQGNQELSQHDNASDAEDKLMMALLDGKALDTTAKRVFTAQARVPQIRTVITSLVQLYPSDPKAQAARSRLSSLMY